MSETVKAAGMVLSAMPVGDYDKRLVILTRERGKITAFARGARRPTSVLLAASNPFVMGEFSLIEGRTAYSLIRAEVQNYFTELAMAQPEVYYGFYFLELADYYGREGMDESPMLNLLYLAVRALLNPHLDDRLVRRIFEMRAMTINGEYAPEEETMRPETLYVCRYIMTSPLQKLFTFAVTQEVQRELEQTLDRHMKRVMDRRMRSLEILKTLA